MNRMLYSVVHKDTEIYRKSSSGGAFTAITDAWISAYGSNAVVYGCVMEDDLSVRHIRATDRYTRDKMCGSKYVGSDMTGVLRAVGEDLKHGKYVCFSGTPCQVAGLKSYLNIQKICTVRKLLTIEIICHGVGSTGYFEDYIFQKEKEYGSKAIYCSFRGKMRPGKRQQMVIHFNDGEKYISPSARYDEFFSAYGRNYILRPSCFYCPYARWERQADIVIGDSWGESDDLKSVRTLVILSNEWGTDWFNRSKQQMQYREISVEQADQPQLNRPTNMPKEYDSFWKIYREKGYGAAQVFLGNWTFYGTVRKLLVTTMYHLNLIECLKWIRNSIQKVKDINGGI